MPKILDAEDSIFSICTCHFALLDRVSPKCLLFSTKLIKILSNIRLRFCTSLLEGNRTASVLRG